MKIIHRTTFSTLIFCLFGFTIFSFAEAETIKKIMPIRKQGTLTYNHPIPESEQFEDTRPTFALGFSTFNMVGSLDNASLTALFNMNSLDTLQVFFSLPRTTPFEIGGM